jgi:hypothetical protein
MSCRVLRFQPHIEVLFSFPASHRRRPTFPRTQPSFPPNEGMKNPSYLVFYYAMLRDLSCLILSYLVLACFPSILSSVVITFVIPFCSQIVSLSLLSSITGTKLNGMKARRLSRAIRTYSPSMSPTICLLQTQMSSWTQGLISMSLRTMQC